MPIYGIFEKETEAQTPPVQIPTPTSGKDRFYSSLTARLLFFVLLLADIAWAFYSLTLFLITGSVHLLTNRKIGFGLLKKSWIGLKRAGICGISLLIALFSPSLGIMVACTYFLMYDKNGIQEVVPASLQDQFQEFLK